MITKRELEKALAEYDAGNVAGIYDVLKAHDMSLSEHQLEQRIAAGGVSKSMAIEDCIAVACREVKDKLGEVGDNWRGYLVPVMLKTAISLSDE